MWRMLVVLWVICWFILAGCAGYVLFFPVNHHSVCDEYINSKVAAIVECDIIGGYCSVMTETGYKFRGVYRPVVGKSIQRCVHRHWEHD